MNLSQLRTLLGAIYTDKLQVRHFSAARAVLAHEVTVKQALTRLKFFLDFQNNSSAFGVLCLVHCVFVKKRVQLPFFLQQDLLLLLAISYRFLLCFVDFPAFFICMGTQTLHRCNVLHSLPLDLVGSRDVQDSAVTQFADRWLQVCGVLELGSLQHGPECVVPDRHYFARLCDLFHAESLIFTGFFCDSWQNFTSGRSLLVKGLSVNRFCHCGAVGHFFRLIEVCLFCSCQGCLQ